MQRRYDYDIPVVRQLRFARRLPAHLLPVHRFQPFTPFFSASSLFLIAHSRIGLYSPFV
jgi:hypothetical protein